MKYNKPSLTISQQIAQLEARGLQFPDKLKAEHYLANISYYRLEGYWWPLQTDKVAHTFKTNSLFNTVIDIYDFDRELRGIVMDMVERIEISMRTRMIYLLSLTHGPWWFENGTIFKNTQHWQKHLFDLRKEVSCSNEVFIKEHKKKYHSDNRCPPAWKCLEVISLGLLSKFYENLSNKVLAKDQIAADLGVANHTYLHSWLQMTSIVRNIAAHHGRLWNRHLPVSPKLLKRAPNPWLIQIPDQRNTSFVALCCMKYLLHTISPDNHFSDRLSNLFTRYPNIDPRAMGFTTNWEHEPLWQ